MIEAEAVQDPASLGVFRYRDYRPLVFVAESQSRLYATHYSHAFQVGLQFRLEVGKELADAVLPGDTDNPGDLAVQLSDCGANGKGHLLAEEGLDVPIVGRANDYFLRSTDSISAIAASSVTGFGAFASRHIRESVSQSPPKAKLSSW